MSITYYNDKFQVSTHSRRGKLVPWYLSGNAPKPVQANKFIGVASLAVAKKNLITPGTLDLVDGANVPTWASATGARFLGGNTNTQYLRTGVTSADGDVSAFVCFNVKENSNDADTLFGIFSTHVFYTQRYNVGGNLIFSTDSTITLAESALATGTHTLAIAGTKAYLDGQPVTGTLAKNAIDIELYLGALNVGGSAVQGAGVDITHWAFWRSVLNASQISEIHKKVYQEATNP